MIQIGSILMGGTSASLKFEERFLSTQVRQKTRASIAGLPIVEEYLAPARHRAITLTAEDDSGWVTYAQLLLLRDMELDGRNFALTLHEMLFSQARFFYRDGPALQLEPINRRPAYDAGDYFKGAIRMIALSVPTTV